MKKIFTLFMSLLLSVSMLTAQGIKFENGSFDDVLKKAKSKGMPIMVDAYTTWCGPCKKMSADVFTSEEVGDFYNENFLNLKLDMEKGEGIAFAEKYEVEAYPSILYFDKNGELVHKIVGFRDISDFNIAGRAALDPEKQLFTLEKRYEKNRGNQKLMWALVEARDEAYMDYNELAEELVNFWQHKEYGQPDKKKFIFDYINNPLHEGFKYFVEHSSEYATEYGLARVQTKVKQSAQYFVQYAVELKKDSFILDGYNRILQKVMPEQAEQEVGLSMIRYLKATDQLERIPEFGGMAVMKTMEKHEKTIQDASLLNQIAWLYYESVDVPDEIPEEDREMIRRDLMMEPLHWIDMALEVEENYYFADTKAALLFKSGNKEEGMNWANKAIQLAKEAEMDYSATEDLIKKWQ